MTELSDIYTETLGIKKTLLVEKRRKEMWRTDKTIHGENKKRPFSIRIMRRSEQFYLKSTRKE